MINLYQKIHDTFLEKGREKKDKLLKPIIKNMPSWIKPSHITSFRLVVLLLALELAFLELINLTIFAIIILLAFLTDLLDGALARYLKKMNRFGEYYDFLTDKIFFLAIFYLFLELTGHLYWLYQIYLEFLFMITIIFFLYFKKEQFINKVNSLRWLIFIFWLIYYLISLLIK